jgi:hypothetical protein
MNGGKKLHESHDQINVLAKKARQMAKDTTVSPI